MINARAPHRPHPLRHPGWRPELGVFILQEGEGQRAILPGVALLGPNGRRLPPRKPIVIGDPASRRRRRGWHARPGALTIAGRIVIGVGLGCIALLAAASCAGSF